MHAHTRTITCTRARARTHARSHTRTRARARLHSVQMMAGTNFWCGIYYALYLFGLSGVGGEAVAFLAAHPQAARDVALFALCGAVGQNFIFATISQFGSLACVTVTTTRKLANILLSVAVNRTPLRAEQWGAVALVFAGLAWNIRDKQARAAADDARLAQKKEG